MHRFDFGIFCGLTASFLCVRARAFKVFELDVVFLTRSYKSAQVPCMSFAALCIGAVTRFDGTVDGVFFLLYGANEIKLCRVLPVRWLQPLSRTKLWGKGSRWARSHVQPMWKRWSSCKRVRKFQVSLEEQKQQHHRVGPLDKIPLI